jgi:hypothetical protein
MTAFWGDTTLPGYPLGIFDMTAPPRRSSR